MTTDTSEKGLETLIMRHMNGRLAMSALPNPGHRPPVEVRPEWYY